MSYCDRCAELERQVGDLQEEVESLRRRAESAEYFIERNTPLDQPKPEEQP